MSKNKKRKLDNSAKIFPIVSSKKYSSVFRISVCLNEIVQKDILQKATEKALSTFESFRVKLKGGFFWYYYAQNEKLPIVKEEEKYPCKYIDPKESNGYLFKVTYKENKVNIDIFHALTDGNSGMHFLKEIIYNYLDITHKNDLKKVSRIDRKVEYTIEDSYIKNYNKNLPSNNNRKKAYVIQGEKLKNPEIGVIYESINVEQLRKKAKENNATITQYLASILVFAIYKANYLKYKGRKPIKVCIPVDLKKYFKSKTINNFFSYITIVLNLQRQRLITFEGILEKVKEEFNQKLTQNEVTKTMSSNVKIGKNLFVGLIPLFLKRAIVKLSYIEIRKYTTITLSNVGRIGIIGDYNNFIDKFMILIAPEQVEKIKCASCSYDNKLVFSFTSTLKDIDIEKEFYQILKNQEIDVQLEDNGIRKIT